MLLESGSEKDLARNIGGATALTVASQEGHWKVVRLLQESGADKDLAKNDGGTAVAAAVEEGDFEVLKW